MMESRGSFNIWLVLSFSHFFECLYLKQHFEKSYMIPPMSFMSQTSNFYFSSFTVVFVLIIKRSSAKLNCTWSSHLWDR